MVKQTKDDSRSKFLLVISILAAIAAVLWIVLSFDNKPEVGNGIGQRKIQNIMVTRLPVIKLNEQFISTSLFNTGSS